MYQMQRVRVETAHAVGMNYQREARPAVAISSQEVPSIVRARREAGLERKQI